MHRVTVFSSLTPVHGSVSFKIVSADTSQNIKTSSRSWALGCSLMARGHKELTEAANCYKSIYHKQKLKTDSE
jgi:hypothetical protein